MNIFTVLFTVVITIQEISETVKHCSKLFRGTDKTNNNNNK